MPVARHNLKVLSQVPFDGFGFGGGFYDDKVFRHKSGVLGSWHPKWRAKNRWDWLLVQIITWEGSFYLFRSKKQETRNKILEARYESLNSTNFSFNIEYRMLIKE
jgi:hypothetical protein